MKKNDKISLREHPKRLGHVAEAMASNARRRHQFYRAILLIKAHKLTSSKAG